MDCNEEIENYRRLIEVEGRQELRDKLAGCYNNRGLDIETQGNLKEAILDYNKAIQIYEQLILKEGQQDLRVDLVACYGNRCIALVKQGAFNIAIDDYEKTIKILKQLADKEGHQELRSELAANYHGIGEAFEACNNLVSAVSNYNLAMEIYNQLDAESCGHDDRSKFAACCNDRGIALEAQGDFEKAVLDYDNAIGAYQQLVKKDGRGELQNELALSFFNRSIIRCKIEEWKGAGEDIDKGGEMLRGLIKEGKSQLVWQFLKIAGFRIRYIKEFGDIRKTIEWANDGLRWLLEKVKKGDKARELMMASHMFMVALNANKELLLREGLDRNIYGLFDSLLNRNKSI